MPNEKTDVCKYCGSNDYTILKVNSRSKEMFFVKCSDCKARGPEMFSKRGALSRWQNDRDGQKNKIQMRAMPKFLDKILKDIKAVEERLVDSIDNIPGIPDSMTAEEIGESLIDGKPFGVIEALKLYSDTENWKIYCIDDKERWVWKGPVKTGYMAAMQVLANESIK